MKRLKSYPSPATQADLRLASRCGEDVRAREQVFRQHAPEIYPIIRRIVGNPTDADDVLQETFVEVFHSIHTYRGEAPLGSWLRRVAVRCACRHCKRNRRQTQLNIIADLPSPEQDLSPLLSSRTTLNRLNLLLEQLAKTRKAVFILHEVEGYPLTEVAAMLGISLTAAKKRVWRARQDLERLAQSDPLLKRFFDEDEVDHD